LRVCSPGCNAYDNSNDGQLQTAGALAFICLLIAFFTLIAADVYHGFYAFGKEHVIAKWCHILKWMTLVSMILTTLGWLLWVIIFPYDSVPGTPSAGSCLGNDIAASLLLIFCFVVQMIKCKT